MSIEYQQVVGLLHDSASPDNQVQTRVYQNLKVFGQQPFFYEILTKILMSSLQTHQIRYMAGIILKSQLKLHFKLIPESSLSELQRVLVQGISACPSQVKDSIKVVIVFLATRQDLANWPSLCNHLVNNLERGLQVQWTLGLLQNLSEDYRYQQQNVTVSSEILEYLSEKIAPYCETSNAKPIRLLAIQVLNSFIVFHIHSFTKIYVQPLLSMASQHDQEIRLNACKGLQQINNFRKDLVNQSVLLVLLQRFSDPSYAIRIQACTFWLQYFTIEDGDEPDRQFLGQVTEKAIRALRFQQIDRKTISIEQDDFIKQIDKEDEGQENDSSSSQTLRRLAGILIEKLVINFDLTIWDNAQSVLKQLLSSSDWKDHQVCVLFIGLFSQNCLSSLKDNPETIIDNLVTNYFDHAQPVLRSTAIWSVSNFQSVLLQLKADQIQGYLLALVKNMQQADPSVRRSACHALSTLIKNDGSILSMYVIDLGKVICAAIQIYEGQSLNSLLSLLNGLAESYQKQIVSSQVGVSAIQCMLKRITNSRIKGKQTAVLLQSLCAINQVVKGQASHFMVKQLQLCLLMMNRLNKPKLSHNQQQLLLRVIDLLSSLPAVDSTSFSAHFPSEALGSLIGLLQLQNSQIKQFSFSFIGSLASNCHQILLPFVEKLLQKVELNLRCSSTALINNCALCITQIVMKFGLNQFAYPLSQKFMAILRSKVHGKMIELNLNRCLAKLANLDYKIATLYKNQVGALFFSAKGESDLVWTGVFIIAQANKKTSQHFFHILVNSFINSSAGQQLKKHFQRVLAEKAKSLGAGWEGYLRQSVFSAGVRSHIKDVYGL